MRLSAVLVAVVLLAGCGGESGDKPARIESKADFIAAADKICLERDTLAARYAREPGSDIGRLSRQLADAYAAAISKHEALALPRGAARAGAEKYVGSVVAMSRPVERMKASATALESATNVPQVNAAKARLAVDVNTVQAIGDVADQNARTYGMKRCGQQQSLNPVT